MNKMQLFFIFWLAGLAACTPIPENVTRVKECAPIYPDYTDITIPYNIAPMNFMIEGAEGLQVTAYGDTDSLRISGKDKARFPIGKWKKLLLQQKGKSVQVRVTALMKGKWLEYPSFQWQVAAEAIDGYLSYRLIEPGYEVWNNLQLCERSLEDFSEKVIADNKLTGGNCMNCHTYGKQSGRLSMFHLRGKNGGTILNRDGKLRKLSLKNDSMISAAVYGDFHPSGRYAVFSSNIIIPAFHAQGSKRLEVYDTESDLAIADFEQNRMILSPLTRDKKYWKLSLLSRQTENIFIIARLHKPRCRTVSASYAIRFAASVLIRKTVLGGNRQTPYGMHANNKAPSVFPKRLPMVNTCCSP